MNHCRPPQNWSLECGAVQIAARQKSSQTTDGPHLIRFCKVLYRTLVVRYLQQVRPRCARREIFLTLKAPFRRLSQGALYHLVSTRLDALGIQIPRRGPHSLPLACAGVTVQVVRAAASIPQAAPRP